MSLTAIYDACILYPAPLRDFLMWLALTKLFKAKRLASEYAVSARDFRELEEVEDDVDQL